ERRPSCRRLRPSRRRITAVPGPAYFGWSGDGERRRLRLARSHAPSSFSRRLACAGRCSAAQSVTFSAAGWGSLVQTAPQADAYSQRAESPQSAAMNCDRLARAYRWLEYAVFGRALEHRRTAFLGELSEAQRILALG